ncbi:hypothetical protein BC831DRAFT_466635 [Entophlyctis helioformis]|nr:hypothetical protein BC831DRAFT_466635 [Entophlyctis helioformis]
MPRKEFGAASGWLGTKSVIFVFVSVRMIMTPLSVYRGRLPAISRNRSRLVACFLTIGPLSFSRSGPVSMPVSVAATCSIWVVFERRVPRRWEASSNAKISPVLGFVTLVLVFVSFLAQRISRSLSISSLRILDAKIERKDCDMCESADELALLDSFCLADGLFEGVGDIFGKSGFDCSAMAILALTLFQNSNCVSGSSCLLIHSAGLMFSSFLSSDVKCRMQPTRYHRAQDVNMFGSCGIESVIPLRSGKAFSLLPRRQARKTKRSRPTCATKRLLPVELA